MRKIKRMRARIISFILILVMLLPMCWDNALSSVFAASSKDTFVSNKISQEQKAEIISYKADIEEFVQPIFGDRGIKTCEYLYNLDDSSDYIYVEFETGGYVVYAKETMEMMEYSLQGILPYDSTAKKYYAGPSNYFHKSSEQFHNVLSGEKIVIVESEMEAAAQKIRNVTINKNATKYDAQATNSFQGEYTSRSETNTILSRTSSSPKLDYNNPIIASTASGTIIPNFKYFITDPIIGRNYDGEVYAHYYSGTCGVIAAQLLLGYHNYYTDRRIIPDRFLLGYDDSVGRVVDTDLNPNYCADPMKMTSETVGTRSDDVDEDDNIIENSFYVELIRKIMVSGTEGADIVDVKFGMGEYLDTRIAEENVYLDSRLTFSSPISSSYIKSEINEGRPIIIVISAALSGNNASHYAVAYGYQNYTYPSGGGTYEGYVTHFGRSGRTCVWVNASWCKGYVSLNINHTHHYQEIKAIPNGKGTESKCTICGHRTDAIVNISSSEVYTEFRTNLIAAEYKEYRITFQTSGNRIFQTFGNKDIFLEFYDTQYNQLIAVDDNGYNYNAYFNYNVQSGQTYILRVRFLNRLNTGDIKISITTATDAFPTYDDLSEQYGTEGQYGFSVLQNRAQVCAFTPSQSGRYEFEYYFTISSEGYALLYVIDPTSTETCISNNGSFSSTITAYLTEGITYYVVVGYGSSITGDVVYLSVDKTT